MIDGETVSRNKKFVLMRKDVNMNIYCNDNNLIIEGADSFDVEEVLECGQCFHFTRLAPKEYELIAKGKYLHIKQQGDVITLYNTSYDEYNDLWRYYFDMDTDYVSIKERILLADERLSGAISSKPGIRIIKQDFFETLISFIISQNKQIPHIKQIVHILSEKYGTGITLENGDVRYLFPTVEQLNDVTEDELRECKVGFRAPYIRDAVTKVYNHEIDEGSLMKMNSRDAREKLMTIKGVGEKVANCVLLFGLSKTDSFPVDVWMKRIMEHMYFHEDTKKEVIEQFANEKFGELSGYAQQYLFCYGREAGIGK